MVADDVQTPNLREGTLLGALLESLTALTVRLFAEPLGARVSHLRAQNGDHEVGLIVERDDHKVLAIEVKLGSAPPDRDLRHLAWLQSQVGDQLVDRIVIATG
ncbi:MAG: DUF4143 domain-containing protein, partial [Bifidobacteriaceae bacterium]|nr:DUF4143 domain-containing protein [Bifidobacteriaceae bacterium]